MLCSAPLFEILGIVIENGTNSSSSLPLLFSLYCSPYCYGSRLENAIGLPDTQDYILLYSLVLTKTTIICKIIESSMILGCCPTIVFIWSKWRDVFSAALGFPIRSEMISHISFLCHYKIMNMYLPVVWKNNLGIECH